LQQERQKPTLKLLPTKEPVISDAFKSMATAKVNELSFKKDGFMAKAFENLLQWSPYQIVQQTLLPTYLKRLTPLIVNLYSIVN